MCSSRSGHWTICLFWLVFLDFYIQIICSICHFNCSNILDLRNEKQQDKKYSVSKIARTSQTSRTFPRTSPWKSPRTSRISLRTTPVPPFGPLDLPNLPDIWKKGLKNSFSNYRDNSHYLGIRLAPFWWCKLNTLAGVEVFGCFQPMWKLVPAEPPQTSSDLSYGPPRPPRPQGEQLKNSIFLLPKLFPLPRNSLGLFLVMQIE